MQQKNKPLWCLVILTFFSFFTETIAQTLQDIADKTLGALVVLEMEDENGQPCGFGSGFFIWRDQIATCFHVIAGATRGTVRLVGTELTYDITGVVATDKKHNLAVLKVADLGVLPLSLGNSDTIQAGEVIHVADNPRLGLKGTIALFEGTITSGTIINTEYVSTDESLKYLDGKMIQISAPIDPNSSGEPVLNRKGEVIAISMSFEGKKSSVGTRPLNLAIPSNYLRALLDRYELVKPLEGEQPITAFIYVFQGNANIKRERYASAVTNFDKAIQLEPDYAQAYYFRGIAKYGLKVYEAAILDFDSFIQFKPDNALAHNYRGLAKHLLGHYQAGIADFDKAIQLNPDDAMIYYNRGSAKVKLEQYKAGIADFDKAIQLEPGYAATYNNRGFARQELGLYKAAIVDFDVAIKIAPGDPNAYINRGIAKYRLGTYADAILDFDTAIRLKPGYPEVHRRHGIAKYRLGTYADAILDFDTAIRLKPDYAKAYKDRGVMKYRLGAYADAILDFNAAIQIDPGNAGAYVRRGMTLAMQNRISKAKLDFQAALKLTKQSNDENLMAIIEQILEINNNEDIKTFIEKSLKNLK